MTPENRPRKRYSTDLTDAQWELVAPLLHQYHRPTHPRRTHTLRDILNGVFYQVRTGCPWRDLPGDLPPWQTLNDYLNKWREWDLLPRLHDTLREQVREQAGRDPQPTAGSLDSQSTKSSEKGGQPAPSASTKARK